MMKHAKSDKKRDPKYNGARKQSRNKRTKL